MIVFLIQVFLLLFSGYVFAPLFGNMNLGNVFRLIALAPYGIVCLCLGLVISLIRLVIGLITRSKLKIFFNLILFVLNLLIGLVFVI